MDIKIIVKYLTLLELPLDEAINEKQVRDNYRKLCLVYHPDISAKRYKDGKKFAELKEACDYIINHLDEINNLMNESSSYEIPNQSNERSASSSYEEKNIHIIRQKQMKMMQKTSMPTITMILIFQRKIWKQQTVGIN